MLAQQQAEAPKNVVTRELIRDSHFQRGFILLEPQPGKRVPYGNIQGLPPEDQSEPAWDLMQWSSKHRLSLADVKERSEATLHLANAAKKIVIGKARTANADLTLGANSSAEYGNRARRDGEPWVHLLVEQTINNPPSLTELSTARLHVEARLKTSRRVDTPDYSPGLHAAQFQIFFSVQNLNRQSTGYGRYLWFGIPLYDDRHRIIPAFYAQDTGGTSMFIYTPSGDVFAPQSTHDKTWVTIDCDLLPWMKQGLETAWQRGFLSESRDMGDYRIASLNMGWELPGIFQVEMQVRNLSMKTIGKS